jgi:hypothetical protein
MNIKRILVVAVAALGMSAAAVFSASAGPASSALAVEGGKAAQPKSTFDLIRGGHHGGHFGGHMGGFRHFGGPGMKHFGGPARYYGGPRMRHLGGPAHWGHGRRGYWRNGRWYWYGAPFIGLGLYGYGNSCYWNCINNGYGPAYCSAYAYDFCY